MTVPPENATPLLAPLTALQKLLNHFEGRGTIIGVFARQHRVVLLRHKQSGTNIDISLGILPFEEELVSRSRNFQVGSLSIRLPTPEDLIILKAVAHRPKDLIDIQAVIGNYPDLDRDRIEFWVKQFAQALELPELWDEIADWLPKK